MSGSFAAPAAVCGEILKARRGQICHFKLPAPVLNYPLTKSPIPMTPDLLARFLQDFLAESRRGVVIEEGQIIFDLEVARYSISTERGKCLLHIWSEERNIVREVMDSEYKNGNLRLSVRKFAQSRPHALQICRDRDQRTAAARKTARSLYSQSLRRALEHEFPDWTVAKLSTSMDLERSFSPVYTRGLLRKGRASRAVLGVNGEETQASVDAALTFGLLWLEDCRQREAGRSAVEGLRLYVPPRRSSTLQLRMAHLNQGIARFELLEFDEAESTTTAKHISGLVQFESRLLRCPDINQLHEQFAESISKVLGIVPEARVNAISPLEISFRLHGLEFARARIAAQPASFRATQEIIFGISGFEDVLTSGNETSFLQFVRGIAESRRPAGDKRHPFWRMYPERWLESLIVNQATALDTRLSADHVYSQVPAFTASDRSLIDVLTCTRNGRLAVLELKADEDIHLPLQGLDYWARVKWHQEQADFQKNGYFQGVQLAPQPPLLFLIAPALRVHPAVETLLRYFSPDIQWTLVGLDERWRDGLRVIFRKASAISVVNI